MFPAYCAQMGVSRRKLESAFKALLRISPAAYARLLKLNNFRRQLDEVIYERQSIGSIADQNGFSHLSNLAQQFRALYACTPQQYVMRERKIRSLDL